MATKTVGIGGSFIGCNATQQALGSVLNQTEFEDRFFNKSVVQQNSVSKTTNVPNQNTPDASKQGSKRESLCKAAPRRTIHCDISGVRHSVIKGKDKFPAPQDIRGLNAEELKANKPKLFKRDKPAVIFFRLIIYQDKKQTTINVPGIITGKT